MGIETYSHYPRKFCSGSSGRREPRGC